MRLCESVCVCAACVIRALSSPIFHQQREHAELFRSWSQGPDLCRQVIERPTSVCLFRVDLSSIQLQLFVRNMDIPPDYYDGEDWRDWRNGNTVDVHENCASTGHFRCTSSYTRLQRSNELDDVHDRVDRPWSGLRHVNVCPWCGGTGDEGLFVRNGFHRPWTGLRMISLICECVSKVRARSTRKTVLTEKWIPVIMNQRSIWANWLHRQYVKEKKEKNNERYRTAVRCYA